ncbi:MAG: hypothetical protein NC084_05580 [Bacteroides sp.]|nr:hypothetical protein [Eubacterium sp.]MCM1418009.1 hypothetical protein [Roseburia sp.]MCM1462168.1 hypothetical protein [Bacteroides sp.]
MKTKKTKRYIALLTAVVTAASAASSVSAETWIIPGTSGSTSTTGPVFSYASEFSVWANGRDIKDDKKTTDVDETAKYKTGEIQHIAMSTGGKWNVAVTDTSISTASQFMGLVDAKGKFTDPNAKEVKQIASAKIKDGTITLTAGKQAGSVNVWVYEINQKQVIYLPERNVVPKCYSAEVKLAPSSPTLAEVGDVTMRKLNTGAKAVTKLTMAYNDGSRATQESKQLALGDKKDSPDITSGYTVTYKNGDKTETPTVVQARVSADNATVTITPTGVGKTTLNIVNIQSGKAAKLTVEVKAMYAVNFDSRLVTVSDISDKKNPVAVSSGDRIINGASLQVTAAEGAEVDEIQVNGKTLKSGGSYKIKDETVEIIAGKTYPVTIVGGDKANYIRYNEKSIKSGAKFFAGTVLTVTIESGVTATVEREGRTPTTLHSGGAQPLTVNGAVTITFNHPPKEDKKTT